MDIVVADFGPQGDTQDLDGTYVDWLDHIGTEAVLVRPDYYIFGTSSLEGVGTLVAAGRSILGKADT